MNCTDTSTTTPALDWRWRRINELLDNCQSPRAKDDDWVRRGFRLHKALRDNPTDERLRQLAGRHPDRRLLGRPHPLLHRYEGADAPRLEAGLRIGMTDEDLARSLNTQPVVIAAYARLFYDAPRQPYPLADPYWENPAFTERMLREFQSGLAQEVLVGFPGFHCFVNFLKLVAPGLPSNEAFLQRRSNLAWMAFAALLPEELRKDKTLATVRSAKRLRHLLQEGAEPTTLEECSRLIAQLVRFLRKLEQDGCVGPPGSEPIAVAPLTITTEMVQHWGQFGRERVKAFLVEHFGLGVEPEPKKKRTRPAKKASPQLVLTI